ncbi:MAG TPA: hypothetical protein VHL98_19540 [Microvirga sp.]|nr:hypothetical protein [Microvirga sp.]
MSMRVEILDRARDLVDWWTPRPRKRRQLTRYAVAAIVVVGLITEASYDALQLAVLVGIYVELMMRKPETASRRPR